MRWLAGPEFSSALLLSKVQAGSQSQFLEPPCQPSPSLPPAHCPPKPPIKGPQVPASISLVSLKPTSPNPGESGLSGAPTTGGP